MPCGSRRFPRIAGAALALLLHSAAFGQDGASSRGADVPPPTPPPASPARDDRVRVRPESGEAAVQRLYEEALRLERAGGLGAAVESLVLVLESEPANQRARERLARLYLARGDQRLAIEILREGLTLDPAAGRIAQLLAHLLFVHGSLAEAIEVLEASPDRARGQDALLAALLQRRGDHARAAELYERALSEDPEPARWWLGLAISLEALGRPEQALAAFRSAAARSGLDGPSRLWIEQRIRALEAGQ